MIAITHILFGVALAKLLDLRVGTVMLIAVLPDIDKLFVFAYPLVRNGVTHSLLAAAVVSLTAFLASNSISTMKSCLTAYISHISIDLFCLNGLTAAYPLKKFYSLGIFAENSLIGNFSVLSFSILLIIATESFELRRKIISFS